MNDPHRTADVESHRTGLASEDVAVRAAAAKALALLGPAASDAAADLCRALDDDEVLVRALAAAALGKIGPAAATPEAVAALSRRLEDPAGPVRFWACEALGRLGPGARDARPALRALTEDPEEAVRRGAAIALRLLAVEGESPGGEPGR